MIEQAFNSFFWDKSSKLLPIVLEQESKGINYHLTHLEELILIGQKQGLDTAIRFIDELTRIFQGNTDSKIFTTVKFDGAPAILAGYHPETGKFFVSTKNPDKASYTVQDIIQNFGHAPGLVEKLKLALLYLPSVIKQNYYQGDFMFSKSDIQEIDYNGEKLFVFKPNTITYAVEADSPLGQKIRNAQIGVVFHTKYTGALGKETSKTPDVSVKEFNLTPEVFIDDARFKDVSGMATLTNQEEALVKNNLDKAQKAGGVVDWLSLNPTTYMNLNKFINVLIRQGRFIDDPDNNFNEFITWYAEGLDKQIANLSTERGRERKIDAKNKHLEYLQANKMSIVNVFFITQLIAEIKKIFIQKYNNAINSRQFIAQPDGTLKVTQPEGYVAVDHEGNMIKLVDRLEFSRANFSIPKELKFKQPNDSI
jgi:hypothetical protein